MSPDNSYYPRIAGQMSTCNGISIRDKLAWERYQLLYELSCKKSNSNYTLEREVLISQAYIEVDEFLELIKDGKQV